MACNLLVKPCISQMLIVLNGVRYTPQPAWLQIPVTQDKAVVKYVDQVVVNFHHRIVQWCLEPFQRKALDENPALFRVN